MIRGSEETKERPDSFVFPEAACAPEPPLSAVCFLPSSVGAASPEGAAPSREVDAVDAGGVVAVDVVEVEDGAADAEGVVDADGVVVDVVVDVVDGVVDVEGVVDVDADGVVVVDVVEVEDGVVDADGVVAVVDVVDVEDGAVDVEAGGVWAVVEAGGLVCAGAVDAGRCVEEPRTIAGRPEDGRFARD